MTTSRYRGNPEALRALVEPDRVHRDLYIDQEVFELEQEHFFANTWNFVGHDSQIPKAGDYYEDRTDLGFKVRVPQKWDPIPASPDDGNLVIKYDPRTNKEIQIGKGETMDLHIWILKFDRRKTAAAITRMIGGMYILFR